MIAIKNYSRRTKLVPSVHVLIYMRILKHSLGLTNEKGQLVHNAQVKCKAIRAERNAV